MLLLNPDAVVEAAAVERLGRALHASASVACVAPVQHRPGSDTPVPGVLALPHPRTSMEGSRRPGPLRPRLGLRDRLGAPGAGRCPGRRGRARRGVLPLCRGSRLGAAGDAPGLDGVVLPRCIGDARRGGHRPRPARAASSDSTPASRPTCGNGTARSAGTPIRWPRRSPRCGGPRCQGAPDAGHRCGWPGSTHWDQPARLGAGGHPPRAHRVPVFAGAKDAG